MLATFVQGRIVRVCGCLECKLVFFFFLFLPFFLFVFKSNGPKKVPSKGDWSADRDREREREGEMACSASCKNLYSMFHGMVYGEETLCIITKTAWMPSKRASAGVHRRGITATSKKWTWDMKKIEKSSRSVDRLIDIFSSLFHHSRSIP